MTASEFSLENEGEVFAWFGVWMIIGAGHETVKEEVKRVGSDSVVTVEVIKPPQ